MTEKKKKASDGKSRREFLKDAGLLVGGTAIGSTVLLAACGGTETETVTNTVTRTQTTTATESKFVCPIDGTEFDSLAALQAHFEATHGDIGAVPGVITLHVNGKDHVVKVDPDMTLAFVIREKLGLTGTKVGCDRGECGTCTIHADGRPILACCMLAVEAQGMDIVTIEGLADGPNLHPVQKLYLEENAYQCGYCTPGFIMSTVYLYSKNPNPSREEVKLALSGNNCPCFHYDAIINAVVKGV
jgi:aerobic-type carbon monoxide dehydrogenase small subunit (CoxS/CutS family)